MSHSNSSDTHFFNSFGLVLGILIVFAIILFGVARSIGAETQGQAVLLEPLHVKDVRENTAPFAHVAVAGRDNSALAIARVSAGAVPAADVPVSGEQANMLPKGGTTWPDATIRMTVDYMVSLNK